MTAKNFYLRSPFTPTAMGLDRMKATLRDRLEQLPSTPDAIAEFLAERSFIGEINSACRCPIALYLSDGLGDYYALRVDDLDHQVSVLGGGLTGRLLHTEPLPIGVIAFIHLFDKGGFPDLVRRVDNDQCQE